jgi:hypothetical protein
LAPLLTRFTNPPFVAVPENVQVVAAMLVMITVNPSAVEDVLPKVGFGQALAALAEVVFSPDRRIAPIKENSTKTLLALNRFIR